MGSGVMMEVGGRVIYKQEGWTGSIMRSSYQHDNTNKKHDNDDDDIRAGGVHAYLIFDIFFTRTHFKS